MFTCPFWIASGGSERWYGECESVHLGLLCVYQRAGALKSRCSSFVYRRIRLFIDTVGQSWYFVLCSLQRNSLTFLGKSNALFACTEDISDIGRSYLDFTHWFVDNLPEALSLALPFRLVGTRSDLSCVRSRVSSFRMHHSSATRSLNF